MSIPIQPRIVGLVILLGLYLPLLGAPIAWGQDREVATKWEYRAVVFGPNAKNATKRLNELAAEGWQYVGPLGNNLVAFKRAERPGAAGKLAEVSGTVTLDGKPIPAGAITFTPFDGLSLTTSAAINEEGKYTARVPVGKMKVSIIAPKVIGKKKLYDTPNSPTVDITVELLPARYNVQTELRFEVTPGKIQANFALQSK
ncbi:MAG TPA: hypothetical protein VEL76_36720 [Gemmataceae bacterium]|nr:hypothetical protein [Gemmataceae bacterium]